MSSPAKHDHRLDWLKTQIDKDQLWLDFELVTVTLSTGIIDAISFPKYRCFVSNQTGNTILFAVSVFSLYGTRHTTAIMVPAPHLAVSLGFFLIGVFAAGQLANIFDSKTARWWLLLSNIVQTGMVLITALINLIYHTGTEINTAPVLCSIGLLALASGAQATMSRQLSHPEIPTTQATAAYVDLFIDPNIFGASNRSRSRRVAFLIALCAGSFIGAPVYHYVSTACAFFLAGVIKLIVTVLFCYNQSKRDSVIS